MKKTESGTQEIRNENCRAASRCGKLAYVVLLLAVAWLAVTGIGTFLFGHPPMTHWVLMAHVGVAPLFAIALAWVALAWSGRYRFGAESASQSCLRLFLFWLILACGLVVILSGVVPMLPIFGTDGQHLLYLTHRYSAIVLTIAVIGHLVFRK